jgi:hypothetical protein
MGPIQATQIAEGGLWRADLQDEVVTGDLRVIRKSGMTVLHTTKEEGVMFRKRELPALLAAFGDGDIHWHAFVVRTRLKSVNQGWTYG